MNRYAYFGGVLCTPLRFSGLPRLAGDMRDRGDIVLELGEVAQAIPDTIWSSPFIKLATDGTALVEIPSAGRFLVRGGSQIAFAPASDALPTVVESIVVSVVAGVVLHQRGALPLHASCLTHRGRTIALSGPSGRGKSTLATALMKRGAELVAEDLSVVQFHGGMPKVVQGALGLRLWPDAVNTVAEPGDVWNPVRPGHAKRVRLIDAVSMPPRRLDAILRLEIANGRESAGIARLEGGGALMPMTDTVYRVHLGRQMGRREALFRDVMRLAQATTILQVRRPDALTALDAGVELVESAIDRLSDRS